MKKIVRKPEKLKQADLLAKVEHLESRLAEAEETLRAIRNGEVDALAIETATGTQIFTLKGAEQPYRVMMETLNEGAVTLAPGGMILYCNKRFADMVKTPLENIIGNSISRFIKPGEETLFQHLTRLVSKGDKKEIFLQDARGAPIPVLLSMSDPCDAPPGSICLLVTDISKLKKAQQELQESHNDLELRIGERTRAFQESEERFQRVFESKLVAIAFWHSDGRLTDANQVFCDLVGYTREEIMNGEVKWTTITPLELLARDQQSIDEINRTGVCTPYEKEFIHRDGRRIPVLIGGAMLGDLRDQGVAFALDIARRRQAEMRSKQLLDSIQAERDRLSALVNSISDEIWFADTEKRFTLMNPSAIKEFDLGAVNGVSVEKLAESLEVFYPDGSPRPVEEAPPLRALGGELVRNQEEIIRTPAKGEMKYRQVSATPVRDASGGIIGSVSVVRDITNLKHAEGVLREREARFHLLSVTAERLLRAEDPQTIVEDLCRDVMRHLDCQAFFNFLVDEKAGRLRLNACAGIPEEDARAIEWLDYGVAVCGCVARDKTRIIAEDILHTPDIRTELVKSFGIQAYCCHPLLSQDSLIGTLSFGTKTRAHFTPDEVDLMRIVADQVAVAMQRRQAEKDLKEHTTKLEDINKELESFSYSISHDLRAPLRAIDGYVRMLLKKHGHEFDEDSMRKFNVIRSSSQMMGKLIEDILTLSRLGRAKMFMVDLEIEGIIKDVWKELQTINPDRNMAMTIKAMPAGYGDRTLIRQVYANLLGNAVKFTKYKNPAEIEVGGYEDGDYHVYYVKDNGVGFDMAYYDKLFGIFQRLHNNPDFEGTGVGLATIQRAVHRHGGRAWAEGKVDEGATFYFSLPSTHTQ